jgi:TM2 domain-containing membrane protein YozV
MHKQFIIALLFLSFIAKATDSRLISLVYLNDTSCVFINDTLANQSFRKKTIAAICAFPFPFGFVGTHRVVLGTKPWVPVVYIATFGGAFGVLPLVDFFLIIFKKDLKEFENNGNVFIWIKHE